MKASLLALGALAGSAVAQRPADTSICDYYTKALLKDNTNENQGKVLTLLVNTVVLGKAMPKPKIDGVTFPEVQDLNGILYPNATYMGQNAVLLPYFDGGLASTNRGNKPTAVNFLDDGAADPLIAGKPSNGNMQSHQYLLLTHLYEFFGALLNCTEQGKGDTFKKYDGNPSMYDVHKYMALNSSQVGYFIQQVGLAAKSFGVTDSDVMAVGKALNDTFGMRCSADVDLLMTGSKAKQAICITNDCPQAAGGSCDGYDEAKIPGVANSTLAMGLGDASSTATGTSSGGASETSGSSSGGSGGSGGSSGGSSSGGGMSSSSSAGAPAATQFAGVIAAGGIAAAAFFL